MPKEVTHICKAIYVYVDTDEWMKLFGDAIRAKGIVPEVALERTLVAAAKEGMAKYNLESLVIK